MSGHRGGIPKPNQRRELVRTISLICRVFIVYLWSIMQCSGMKLYKYSNISVMMLGGAGMIWTIKLRITHSATIPIICLRYFKLVVIITIFVKQTVRP